MHPALPALLLTASLLAACSPLGGGPGGRDDNPSGRREMGGGGAAIVGQLQGQLQDTATALNLAPAQLVLWDTYQERVGALMADQIKLTPYRTPRQNAPQQIAGKVDTVRNRLTALEEIQEAANQLYASLDDEQKRTADRLLPATVPALYSGLAGEAVGEGRREAGSPGERGGPGGGRGGPGGGMGSMGGGFGRM